MKSNEVLKLLQITRPTLTKYVKEGLFISNHGVKINADVNGAYQIMKKVSPNLFDGVEGVGLHPFKVNINQY